VSEPIDSGEAAAPPGEATAAPAAASTTPTAPPAPPPPVIVREPAVMLRVTLALFVIGLGVWLLLAGTAHRRNYSAAGAAWHRGARNFIEITLLREDRANLACAANAVMDGLHCGLDATRAPHPAGGDDARVLRPYNTVNGELFLGAGLWDSPALHAGLPTQRFTVVCDYEIVGALRSVLLRWSPAGDFVPVDRSLAVGSLRDCSIPP